MTLRRCSCLLLVALLVLSSCGFSPFKTAFAADIIVPDYSGASVSIGYADNSASLGLWDLGSTWKTSVPIQSGYSPYQYKIPLSDQDIWYVSVSFNNVFYFSTSTPYKYFLYGGMQFSQVSSPDEEVIPSSVYLRFRINSPSGIFFENHECQLIQFASSGAMQWQYDFSYDETKYPSGTTIGITGLYFLYTDPSDSTLSYPDDSDYAGLPSTDGVLSLTSTYYRLQSYPSDEEAFQDSVSDSLDDINNDINKGFDSIQGEISSGTDEVVDAVDGVKNSVDDLNSTAQEWGQNIVNGITEGATAIQETITEESEKLGNFILDGLKSLFIPRDGYFKELFDDLNSFFSEVFGFLYFPIEHALSWFNRLLNLPEVAPSIAIPELAYEGEVLIPAQTYTFDFLQDEPFSTVHDYYLMAIDAAMIMSFVHLLQRKYEEVMRN